MSDQPAGDPAGQRRPALRRTRFTSRAAVLAIVVCAIALSLAYPVREFIAQHRQIDKLLAQRQQVTSQLSRLRAEDRELSSPAYVEQQARDKLHMCPPRQTCYVIINGQRRAGRDARASAAGLSWYQRVWTSLQQADHQRAR
jgi:cell division protein FtsL